MLGYSSILVGCLLALVAVPALGEQPMFLARGVVVHASSNYDSALGSGISVELPFLEDRIEIEPGVYRQDSFAAFIFDVESVPGFSDCYATEIRYVNDGPDGDSFVAETNDCDNEFTGSDRLFSISLKDSSGTALNSLAFVPPTDFSLWEEGQIELEGDLFLIRGTVTGLPELRSLEAGLIAALPLALLSARRAQLAARLEWRKGER